ncbi:MAG: S1/P1 nuclease [Terriglobales bacterium]
MLKIVAPFDVRHWTLMACATVPAISAVAEVMRLGQRFKRVLGDKSAPRDDRIEALKFIVHFVGDIHQPFHAIGEAKGGNGVHITEFGSDRCGIPATCTRLCLFCEAAATMPDRRRLHGY